VEGTFSVGLWNVEWAAPRSSRGAYFRRRLAELACDVLCVNEGAAELLPADGHVITSAADFGYPLVPGRRKVVLWSRLPWCAVDPEGSPRLPPGRFVAGTTDTPRGPVRFVGVCIPWRDAHVRTGHRNRQPWQDHLTYLEHLPPLLHNGHSLPTVLLGDLNQRVPRTRQPAHVYAALTAALAPGFRLVTDGHLAGAPEFSIDHVAVSGPLRSVQTTYLDQHDGEGMPMSDHFGLRVVLA
jgi:endonuclease/exonuclease/phosphatase family metal-dependent hydrolase